jgi:hypothetical protein
MDPDGTVRLLSTILAGSHGLVRGEIPSDQPMALVTFPIDPTAGHKLIARILWRHSKYTQFPLPMTGLRISP